MGDRQQDPDVVYVERDEDVGGGHSVAWFLLGALVGAAAAVLLTPQTGEETRRAIRGRARKLKEVTGEKIEALRSRFSDGEEDEDEDEDEEEEGVEGDRDDNPGTGKGKGMSGARKELERRLAAARARRGQQPDPEDDEEEPVA